MYKFYFHRQTWKRLRNQYLNLQREKIKQMKRSIKLEKSKTENHNTIQTTKITPTRNINFYGALMDKKDDEDDELQVRKYESQEDVLKKKPLFSYQSGIIIKIKLNEPCLELKCFKVSIHYNFLSLLIYYSLLVILE